jgi:hypothetical protein
VTIINGEVRFMAFRTNEADDPDDPCVPGICTECGSLVPGYNVRMMMDDGITSPAWMHNDWHKRHGDVPESLDAPHE